MKINPFAIGNQRKILVKFKIPTSQVPIFTEHFNDTRLTDEQLDRLHAEASRKAGQGDLAQVGRHRKGRVDTGEPLAEGDNGKAAALVNADVADFVTDLQRAGYVLANYGYFQKDSQDTHCFVQLLFAKGATAFPLRNETQQALTDLTKTIWQNVWVYDNPDGSTTVNCTGNRGKAAKLHLRIVKGQCTALED